MLTTRPAAALSRFANDERGATALIFGLTSTAILFAAGMGVDMTRVVLAKSRIGVAADAAALTAGKALLDGKLSNAEIRTQALNIFNSNIQAGRGIFANIKNVKISVDRGTGKVAVDVDANVDMTLTRIAGFTNVALPYSNSAVFATRDIEVGMALDITGSMSQVPSGGGPAKIDGLKTAFAKFANTIIPAQPVAGQKVRIALAPYSAAVNLGAYAAAASNSRSLDGCVTERTTSDRYSDKSTTAGGYFDVKSDGVADIDPTEGTSSNSYICPGTQVTPLSDDRATLISKVNAFVPNGWTAGHIGVQWAWNMISEDWGGVFNGASQPDGYDRVGKGKLIKAVVLMTDGIFNTAYHNDDAARQAIALCDSMKARGVQVFAVAFDAPASAQTTLKACASPGTDYYANASNAAELDAAFAKFAGKLGELRLSN